MRRALVACLCLGLGSGPIGVFLMLRRMSLVGDAMSHAILPGAAIGYLVAGSLSLTAMGIGGLVAGLAVALLSGAVSRVTVLQEDASFASFYLASLALGVLIVSLRGSNIDLLHVLFGTILAIDAPALYQIGAITTLTLVLAMIYRPLIVECFDPSFLRAIGGRGPVYHFLFLLLVVLNLVASFQALGTLMAVGSDDAAGSDRAALGAQPAVDDAGCGGKCCGVRLFRPDRLLSSRARLRADDHHDGGLIYGFSIFFAPSGLRPTLLPAPASQGLNQRILR
jgi:zinc/manganese transport system permease protein